jgi:hypothetical protein
MDQAHAWEVLAAERARLERLLAAGSGEPQPAGVGDEVDDADRRERSETGTAVEGSCARGGRPWSGRRRGSPPAATGGRSAAAGRSPTSGWRPTRWPS